MATLGMLIARKLGLNNFNDWILPVKLKILLGQILWCLKIKTLDRRSFRQTDEVLLTTHTDSVR